MYGILAMQDLLSRLQLRHFRLVRAVSETGQLSLAAELLAMTQPAASRALAEVERLLGQRLFARHPKGMTPTPEGEVLARHAAELLGGLDLAAEEIASFRQGRSGRARVGAVTGAALEYVMPSVRALKAQAPEAEIRVDVAPSTELMAGLMNGELDFVLCRVPPGTDPRRLEILRGRVEHLSFLVRHGHPLAQVVAVPLSALEPYSFIMQAPGMPIREAVDQAHVAAGHARNRSSTRSIRRWASGVSCRPRRRIRWYGDSVRASFMSSAAIPPPLVWRSRSATSRAAGETAFELPR